MEGMFLDDIVLVENILCGNNGSTELKLPFLEYITDNFSEKREVGRSRFCVVYKGDFNNRNVTVKKFDVSNREETKDFGSVIGSLLMVYHKNIVQLLGYCNVTRVEYVNVAKQGEPERLSFVSRNECILCLEYIGNGSLTNKIHDELRGLEWHTRYKILKEICLALEYLHTRHHLVHRDLNPDNILLDNLWVPKIAGLGTAELIDNGEITMTNNATWEYAAPEFKDRVVSVKYDIYSLGIIITELVTGVRNSPDIKNVLTRWRHRWNKSNEILKYQQVAKCIELAQLCKNEKPKNRPSISKIISELEDVDSGNGAFEQVLPCWNELLWIEPPEIFFSFQMNKQISCSLELHNDTDTHMAFLIRTGSEFEYHVVPTKGVVQPCSPFTVKITLLAQGEAPAGRMRYIDEFTVKSTRVNEGLTAEDIATDMFSKRSGNTVDRMRLHVVFDAQLIAPCKVEEEPKEHLSLAPLEISGSQEKSEASSEAESRTHSLSDLDKKVGTSLGHLSLQYLKDITNNFSNELGRGGFGVVYKGVLQDGEIVAVKKILQAMMTSEQAILTSEKQFENEVDLLMKLKHPNVVRLIGYCYETKRLHTPLEGKFVFTWNTESLIVLECLPNGSLDKYISDASSGLDWHTRRKTIEGISYGLQYLHEQPNGPVIHLDLKPANILLDENMVAKITDFGMSRLLDKAQTICTSNMGGTLGYMPPEYLRGTITPMSDIYSLGVIIMEVITGHKDFPYYDIRTLSEDFIKLEHKKWRNVLQEKLGYTSLERDCQQIKRFLQVGLICVNPNRTKRPTIKKVIDMLQGVESMDWYITNELTPAAHN